MLVLAVIWVLLGTAGLYVMLRSGVPPRPPGEAVLDGTVSSDLHGWTVRSAADPVTMERRTGLSGPRRIDTAVELKRSGDSGPWAFALVGLADPVRFFRIDGVYRMQLYVRDLDASGRPVTLQVANGAGQHRPTTATVGGGFTDRSWHRLSRTFVATATASEDTALYLSLPPSGPLHWQLTLASVTPLSLSPPPEISSAPRTLPAGATLPPGSYVEVVVPAGGTPALRLGSFDVFGPDGIRPVADGRAHRYGVYLDAESAWLYVDRSVRGVLFARDVERAGGEWSFGGVAGSGPVSMWVGGVPS
ncbi:hypothetical protein [Cryptosporangium phraense]|uniref:Uncharacterized protein n=1 Tax=Cryptosporangium phraense TaxID=2593070 RepID=A0A545AJM0_9ACTN|nr:hypothetical protein [Cryptosporangium phraense]TQS41512.1 hypothetical protein FL583_28930 [Cryptosporangium phraense]